MLNTAVNLKTYYRPLEWTDKTQWCWPALDKKLIIVFDHSAHIDRYMQYVDKRDVCIQAGGACGVFALRYSQLFERVYTFEPQPDNFACLVDNCDVDNVIAYNAPLSNDNENYSISDDIFGRENFGAGYSVPDKNGLQAMRIDELSLDACDFIQLDIEGFEGNALHGGAETIDKYRPVIVLEEKKLNHMPFSECIKARQWLESEFGYRQVDKIHWDVVLKC